MKESQTEKFVVGMEDLRAHLKLYVRAYKDVERIQARKFFSTKCWVHKNTQYFVNKTFFAQILQTFQSGKNRQTVFIYSCSARFISVEIIYMNMRPCPN